ncbi:uncharacterized protein A4U43_C05F12610 [Asparagus officinalis]|uniref:Uncharacterized protein n=1 Tax=Asparagus officinalis TaxID=4686 RepID=A0A5P1ER74_ASPOF|nr:uncharacterized protein A4U43_C05F12610 [Asparagus officinalis]
MSPSPISSSATIESALQPHHLRQSLRIPRDGEEAIGEMDGEERGEGVEEKEGEVEHIKPMRSIVVGGKGRLREDMDGFGDGLWSARGVEGADQALDDWNQLVIKIVASLVGVLDLMNFLFLDFPQSRVSSTERSNYFSSNRRFPVVEKR